MKLTHGGSLATTVFAIAVAGTTLFAPQDAATHSTHATPRAAGAASPPAESSCVECHAGIEDIHPGYELTCVDCHGGDEAEAEKDKAHVLPQRQPPGDERVLPQDWDLDWQQFVNPSNLRVAERVCGDCHEEVVNRVMKSLHATTAGHLGDGFYENGLTASKQPRYSIFPIKDTDGDLGEHGIKSMTQVPGYDHQGDVDDIGTHFTDLTRKACMHCHLWSPGRAVDGRVGLDGDYRGEGCAACHVTYANDGRSKSADRSAVRLEPGHPLKHRFTTAPPTSTCTKCHYGDASIGLHFRGLAQLVPGMPAGPEVEGTTDELQNGVFYIQDPDLTPPDVHHQRGMHCIDCHTSNDVMGDGNLYPQMDHAVEIECTSCHGTFDAVSDLKTTRGRPVSNLEREGDLVWLRSKVTGRKHEVVQVAHVVDPDRPEYSPRAARAMTEKHKKLECYTCHGGWNVNFFGFHFDRNEQFSQLDLLSGKRTPGRVTTQEKVFSTFNQLRLGYNHEGMIAPYMVGFSTIGSAWDKDGNKVLHQALPVTKAGLSGVTLVPHQLHTTRPEARSCVECHRSPVTWGLGSTNFRLTREYGYGITDEALWSVALDAKNPGRSEAVADLELIGSLRALAIRQDPVRGGATHAYAAAADGALHVVDLSNPVLPRPVRTQKGIFADPKALHVQGDLLLAADGAGGVLVFDLKDPRKPRELAAVPTVDARALAVAWPYVLVADGAGGLVIFDAGDRQRPVHVATVDLNGRSDALQSGNDVAAFFQYSRTKARDPLGERLKRSEARHLAFVAAGTDGVVIVDWTEPRAPRIITQSAANKFLGQAIDVQGVALNTAFDLGSAGGGLKSRERDYLFVCLDNGRNQGRRRRVIALDVSDPLAPLRVEGNDEITGGTGRLEIMRVYNAPFLQQFVVASGAGGLGTVFDASAMPTGFRTLATLSGPANLRDFAVEEFAFDRLQDERGKPEKDISHADCRYLTEDEMLRVLRADIGEGPR